MQKKLKNQHPIRAPANVFWTVERIIRQKH